MVNVRNVRFDQTKILSYHAGIEPETNRIFVQLRFNTDGLNPLYFHCNDVNDRDDLLQRLDLIFKPNRG